jgi:RNA polymerase sigma-70 factor (ECF subfamily)
MLPSHTSIDRLEAVAETACRPGATGTAGDGPIEDPDAFVAVYLRHREPLYQFCLARTKDRALAEDIVQEVFEKAFAVRHRFDEARRAWPWLVSIAGRECIDAFRRRSYAGSRLVELAQAGRQEPQVSTETMVLDRLEGKRLERHMAALPLRQRIALQLYALDGWSYAEIATQFGCSIASVKALMMRARARLREAGAASLGAVAGAARTLRARLHGMLHTASAAVSGWGDSVGGTIYSLGAGGLALLVAATALVTSAVDPASPSEPGPASEAAVTPIHSTPSIAAERAVPVERVPEQPMASPPPVVAPEPISRRYAGAAERAGWETAAPLLPLSGDEEGGAGQAITVSPGYERDRTIFVAGARFERSAAASPLLVTHDGGATWSSRRALGVESVNEVLLPPAYPRDNRVFVVSPRGLHVSRDGGETFETLVPMSEPADADLSPRFNEGEPAVLLVAGGRLFEYRDDSLVVSALALPPASAGMLVTTASYGPDSSLVVGTVRSTAGRSRLRLEVNRCTRSTSSSAIVSPIERAAGLVHLDCEAITLPNPQFDQLAVRLSSSGPEGVILASDGLSLYVSKDRGRHFDQVLASTPASYTFVNDIAPLPDARDSFLVAQVTYRCTARECTIGPSLVRTDDGGRTWASLDLRLPEFTVVEAVAVTPTGRVLAIGAYGTGMACSLDGGGTWHRTCPSPDVG